MTLYRRKPIVVTAVQFWPQDPPKAAIIDDSGFVSEPARARKPEKHGVIFVPAMTADAKARRGITYPTPAHYMINTQEGQQQVSPGDWIITLPSGRKWRERSADFQQLYERAHVTVSDYPMESVVRLAAIITVMAILLGILMMRVWP